MADTRGSGVGAVTAEFVVVVGVLVIKLLKKSKKKKNLVPCIENGLHNVNVVGG